MTTFWWVQITWRYSYCGDGLTRAEVLGEGDGFFCVLQTDQFHGDGAAVLIGQEEVEHRSVRVLRRDEVTIVADPSRRYALPTCSVIDWLVMHRHLWTRRSTQSFFPVHLIRVTYFIYGAALPLFFNVKLFKLNFTTLPVQIIYYEF